MKNNIIHSIETQLQELKNSDNAQAMAAYMKTNMPFYGVKATERRLIAKQAIKEYPVQNQKEYVAIIETLWNKTHREAKYIAIDIARAYPRYVDPTTLPLFETMIRQGAWWDFVDDIAIQLVGSVLLLNPSAMWPRLQQWINDSNLWIRRTAIICQNRFKHKTNEQYLFSFCLQQAHDKDFFIKKAIGWALREYAKTEPHKVHIFVEQNKEQLSKLSYTEAVKHLGKKL